MRLAAIAAVTTTVAVFTMFDGAQAQGGRCLKFTYRTADLPAPSLEIHRGDGEYLEDAPASRLGASFTLIECGDPTYYGFFYKGSWKLVPKISTMNLPKVSPGCYCPAPGGNPALSARAAQLAGPAQQCPIQQCAAN
jgi:hypothetical protein